MAVSERPLPIAFGDVEGDRGCGLVEVPEYVRAPTARMHLVENRADPCAEADREPMSVELLMIEHPAVIGCGERKLRIREHEYEYEYEYEREREHEWGVSVAAALRRRLRGLSGHCAPADLFNVDPTTPRRRLLARPDVLARRDVALLRGAHHVALAGCAGGLRGLTHVRVQREDTDLAVLTVCVGLALIGRERGRRSGHDREKSGGQQKSAEHAETFL